MQRWKKENLIIYNLYKEKLFYRRYSKNAFYIFLNYLNYYFKKPLQYSFNYTNSMKIKAYLWVSPKMFDLNIKPLIELRSLCRRAKDFVMFLYKNNFWKGYKILKPLKYKMFF